MYTYIISSRKKTRQQIRLTCSIKVHTYRYCDIVAIHPSRFQFKTILTKLDWQLFNAYLSDSD